MIFHVRFICDSFSLNKMKRSRGPIVSECEIQAFARYENLQPRTKSAAAARGSSASDKRFTFGKGWRSNDQKAAILGLCCFVGHSVLRTTH
jgi:hypothetical protein